MKQFLPYELAFLFKEKGYQESSFGLYSPSGELHKEALYRYVENEPYVLAPTYDQAIDFLETKHNMYICPCVYETRGDEVLWCCYVLKKENEDVSGVGIIKVFNDQPDRYTALQAGFKHALNLLP